jgi:competence protein ComEC
MALLPILRKSPFSRLLFFYAAGIAIASKLGFHPFLMIELAGILLLLLFVLLMLILNYRHYNTGWVSGSLATVILFLCGIWAMEVQFRQEKMADVLPETPQEYRIRLIDLPETLKGSTRVTARVLEVKDDQTWTKQNLRIQIYFDLFVSKELISPGTELQIHTGLKKVPRPGNPGEFNYNLYLAARHIYRQAFVKDGDWHDYDSGHNWSVRARACLMRARLLQSFEKLDLEPSAYGLISALTLGYKEDLDARTKQIFSRAGVMHIMALSGFNVGIIALVLGFLLGIFDTNPAGRIVKTLIIIIFLWLFALVTGLSPSVTRATVMISFVMAGKLFHRPVNTYNVLFTSAFLLLAFTPGMLNDVSFQLSFAAVAGILLYQPILYDLAIFRLKFLNRLWQLFTLTLAAQLATFPLTLYYFHQFPVYFWLTNMYVIPLVSLIVCIAGIYLALSFIQPLVMIFGKILALLLKALFFSVAVTEDLPFSLISGVHISAPQAAILVIMVLVLAMFILFRKSMWIFCFLSAWIALFTLNALNSRRLGRQDIWMVGNVRGETAINIVRGRKAVVLLDHGHHSDDARLTYSFGDFWISHGLKPCLYSMDTSSSESIQIFDGLFCRMGWRGKNCMVSAKNRRMVILRDDQFYSYHSVNPLAVDMLVVTGSLSVKPYRMYKEILPEILILDSSVKRYQAEQWKQAGERLGIFCYPVTEKGAFINYP